MAIFSSHSSSSSSSSFSSSNNSKAWIIHGIVVGVSIVAAAGAHVYFTRFYKFRSRVVGIIPARFASSRFPGKPLVQILGKPMIQNKFLKIFSQVTRPLDSHSITQLLFGVPTYIPRDEFDIAEDIEESDNEVDDGNGARGDDDDDDDGGGSGGDDYCCQNRDQNREIHGFCDFVHPKQFES
ncbi:unnamed protein product [Vicia faba]|uniref:Transmembrane protein n=1 Tax=Vicia faba TaxID=3906 RepID=A0AAV1A8G1_VICFA|nr:unnamed protein product [Vicia faba]